MLVSLKNWLYNLFVRSHIVYYLFPIFRPIAMVKMLSKPAETKNETISDEAGSTMRVTRYGGKIYPAFNSHRLSTIKDIRIRKEDIILCGYPKTGCHWTYEILYMLLHKSAKLSKYGKGAGMIDAMPDFVLDSVPSPRVMNSHLLYDELPRGIKQNGTKIVLTVRCAKDTVVSYYNHVKALEFTYQYKGLFENYFKMFMKGELEYGSYYDFYQQWDTVIRTQDVNQVFVLEFEELKKDTWKKVMELASFLDLSITEEFAKQIAEASQIGNMKKKEPKNKILRKGVVGDWKNWLTDDQMREINDASKEKMPDLSL